MKKWRSKVINILALAVMVGLVVLSGLQEKAFKDKWQTAIDGMEEVLMETPGIYENITKQELSEMFQELRKDVDSGLRDEKTLFIRLEEILAACKHLHLSVNYIDTKDFWFFHVYPIQFEWTRDGLVITDCDKEYVNSVGAVVRTIGGLSVDEYVDRISTIKSCETLVGQKRQLLNAWLAEELVFLEVIDKVSDKLVLEVEKDGKVFSIELDSVLYALINSVEWANIWDDTDSEDIPFRYQAIQKMEQSGHYTYYEADMENGVMLLEYSSCMEDPQYFYECFDNMIEEMRENKDILDTLVIDVSSNKGGNSYLLMSKLYEYKFFLLTKEIKLIIGYQTASSGVNAIEDAMTFFPTVETYGSPTQGAIYNYTEVVFRDYPEINIRLGLPTKFSNMPRLKEKYGHIKDSVYPDHEVMISYSELLQGKDAVYDAIIGK